MPPAGGAYGMPPPGPAMYGPPPPQQPSTYVVQGGFDAGARFDGISNPNIPVSSLFISTSVSAGICKCSAGLPCILESHGI